MENETGSSHSSVHSSPSNSSSADSSPPDSSSPDNSLVQGPSPATPDPTDSRLQLTARQREARALLRSRRHALLVGGARSGKTTVIVNEIAERAVKFPGSRHAILRLRFNAVRPSIALDTLPKVFRLGFPSVRLKLHRTDGYFAVGAPDEESEIWFGGLDDDQRAEKILGKEYVTIFFNECSQIPYASVLMGLTRLAQVVDGLPQAAFYDLNPTSKAHWTHLLFGEHRDPTSRLPLDDPQDYGRLFLNPADNAHLSQGYLKSLQRLPERQRKRFYEGVYIDDLDGALFSYDIIARNRVVEFPPARRARTVVAVDPSGARANDDNGRDEIGIVVAARGDDGHAYVLADRSLRDSPRIWGGAVARAAQEFGVDCIVVEQNFGGDMAPHVIATAGAQVAVRTITASRGKAVRAEPVSALYEQGLVHHVGRFGVLEDQLCAFTTAGYRGEGSPDHADALVFAVTELLLAGGAAILEFYRQQAEERKATGAHRETGVAEKPAAAAGVPAAARGPAAAADVVRLVPPLPVSAVHGSSGALYVAAADGSFAVTPEDARALIGHGFAQIEEGETDDPLPIEPPLCGAADSTGAA